MLNIFINNLNDGTECSISKFANETKLGGGADPSEGCSVIHRDLGRLEKWTERNLMKLSKEKCRVLPLGRIHLCCCTGCMAANQLESSFEEKGPGGP